MKKQGFIYGSVILAASAVITKIIGALFRIPMASLLGGTGMGYFSSAYGIFMPVYAVTAAGLPAAAARLTARDSAKGGASLSRIRKTGLLLFTAAGIIGMLLILAAAPLFCKYVIHNTAALPSVIIIAPTVLFGCPCAVLRGYYEGRMNMYPTALSQVAEALVKLAAGLGGAYAVIKYRGNNSNLTLSYASAAACGGITLSVLAGLLFMIAYDCVQRRSESPRICHKADIMPIKTVIRELASVAVPGAFCALAANITSVIDLASIINSLEKTVNAYPQLFSQYDMPLSEIPNYIYGCFSGLAVTVFNLVPSVTNMFGKGILPAASESCGKGDRSALAKCAEQVVTVTAFVAIPCALGIAALAKPILFLLFSHSTAEVSTAAPSLAAMTPGLVFLCISSAVFPVFQAADRADIPVKLTLAGVAVKAAGNILLVPIPSLGIIGASISTDLCYGVIFIASMLMLKKIADISMKRLSAVLAKLTLAGVFCAAAALFSLKYTANSCGSSLSTVISIAFGGLIYIIITYFTGIFCESTLKMPISKKIKKNT